MDTKKTMTTKGKKEVGSLWVSKQNGQLRYKPSEAGEEWIAPLSTYKSGSASPLKRGQPVSIGLLSQLTEQAAQDADAAIVLADPAVNSSAVGLLLEPSSKDGHPLHVQSHGQIEYDYAKADDERYYIPPKTWTYDDIGKPVYVSNAEGMKGELTLSLADATQNGGTIICVGRLADAPLNPGKGTVTIEIALSGDVRGAIDTSQLSIHLSDADPTVIRELTGQQHDRLLPVRLLSSGTGAFVFSASELKESDVVGLFSASPDENGVIDLTQFYGKDIVVTRLGLLRGDFGFSPATYGRTAYLDKDGLIDFESPADSVEYKVGVSFGSDLFLVDCRYARTVARSEMIGTIKPLFENGLIDDGYVKIDETVHHPEEGLDDLVRFTYSKDLFLFSLDGSEPSKHFRELGLTSIEDVLSNSNAAFKFRSIHYTLDGGATASCQIKFSKEGEPDAQAYVWPEQAFQFTIRPGMGGPVGSSNIRVNITHLVELGAYMGDTDSQDIDAYEICCVDTQSGLTCAPGFWQRQSDGMWVGYEWSIYKSGTQTWLMMVTVPGDVDRYDRCLGFTWPRGERLTEARDLLIVVRKRPTQYNSVFLNQFPSKNPWTPLVDSSGNIVVQGDYIYFGGEVEPDPTTGYARPTGLSSVSLCPAGAEGAVLEYKIQPTPETGANAFIERFSVGDDHHVEWKYTFDTDDGVPVAELSAKFAASFVAESTKNEEPDTQYTDSALKIFTALWPHVFTSKKTNGETISITAAHLADFMKNGYKYNFFKGDGTSWNEAVLNDQADSFVSEIDKHDEEVRRAIRDAFTDEDRVSYQSYLGLLARAAGETGTRLEMVDRILFGDSKLDLNGKFSYFIDRDGLLRFFDFLNTFGFYTHDSKNVLPEGFLSASMNGVYSHFLNFLAENYGRYEVKSDFIDDTMDADQKRYRDESLEAAAALKKIGIFSSNGNNNTSYSVVKPKLSDSYSLLGQSGPEYALEEWTKKNDKQLSHLAELWIYYNSLGIFSSELYNARGFVNGLQSYHAAEGNVIQSTSIKNMYPLKITQGYNTDKPESDCFADILKENIPKGIYGTPYKWPIYVGGWEERAGYSVESNFFGNTIIGISDGKPYRDHFEGATFAPQSLEGIIYDLIVKLSFIRKQFTLNTDFVAAKTFTSSFKALDDSIATSTIPIINLVDKDSRMFNQESDDASVYSAFMFDSNDKISRALSLVIGTRSPSLTITNGDDDRDSLYWMEKRWGGNLGVPQIGSHVFNEIAQIYLLATLPLIVKARGVVGVSLPIQPKFFVDDSVNNRFIRALESTNWDAKFKTEIDKDAEGEALIESHVNRLINSIECTGANAEVILSIIDNESDKINIDFLKNDFWVTYEELICGKPDFNFFDCVWGMGFSESVFGISRYPTERDYYQTVCSWKHTAPAVARALEVLDKSYSKLKDLPSLFVGFFNGITGEGSQWQKNSPWTQKPLGANELSWRDQDGNTHSSDFNDFIDKRGGQYPIDIFNQSQRGQYQNFYKKEVGKEDETLRAVEDFVPSSLDDIPASECNIGEVLEPVAAGKPLMKLEVVAAQDQATRNDKLGYYVTREYFGSGRVQEVPISQAVPGNGVLSYTTVNRTYNVPVSISFANGYNPYGVSISASASVTIPEKIYYTRPLVQDDVLINDGFNRVPVVKTTAAIETDRVSASRTTYTTPAATTIQKMNEAESNASLFRLKDGSYLNGQVLPVPDCKLRLDTDKLVSLLNLYQSKNPALHVETPESKMIDVKRSLCINPENAGYKDGKGTILTWNVKWETSGGKVLALIILGGDTEDDWAILPVASITLCEVYCLPYKGNSLTSGVIRTECIQESLEIGGVIEPSNDTGDVPEDAPGPALFRKRQTFFFDVKIAAGHKDWDEKRRKDNRRILNSDAFMQTVRLSLNEGSELYDIMSRTKMQTSENGGLNADQTGNPDTGNMYVDIEQWGDYILENSTLVETKHTGIVDIEKHTLTGQNLGERFPAFKEWPTKQGMRDNGFYPLSMYRDVQQKYKLMLVDPNDFDSSEGGD